MDAPVASQETRQIGRSIYVFGALTFAVDSFGLKLDSSDSFPISLPDSFPVSGALSLCVAALALPMLFRVGSELIIHFDTQLSSPNDALSTPSSLEILRNPAVSRGTFKGYFRYHAPMFRFTFDWLTFIIETITPILLSIFLVIACWSSVLFVFSNDIRKDPNWSCNFSKLYLSENPLVKGTTMIQAHITFTDSKSNDVPMQRVTNPDGTVGGMVATNVRIPKNVTIPFNSIVCPGAKINASDVIPPATIIDADGGRQPNVIRNIRDLTISRN